MSLLIENIISIDDSGMPKPPTINQLLDKDICLLYARDNTKDKMKYMKECGVIYYLADPRSPARQQGLTDAECIKEAIENFDLPKDYSPDSLVLKIVNRYYKLAVGPAGVALENLYRSIHTADIIINKCHDLLTEKLNNGVTQEDIGPIIDNLDKITSRAKQIPELMKAVSVAKENLKEESEQVMARGGKGVTSSMDANNSL